MPFETRCEPMHMIDEAGELIFARPIISVEANKTRVWLEDMKTGKRLKLYGALKVSADDYFKRPADKIELSKWVFSLFNFEVQHEHRS